MAEIGAVVGFGNVVPVLPNAHPLDKAMRTICQRLGGREFGLGKLEKVLLVINKIRNPTAVTSGCRAAFWGFDGRGRQRLRIRHKVTNDSEKVDDF
jgi:hypothetical protein